MLNNTELRQLRGLVFGSLKGGTRRTIKKEKPIGTQHDCFGLVREVELKDLGPATHELWDEPSGHPEREDWKKAKAKKRKARKAKAARRAPSKRRAARDTAEHAKGVSPKPPRKPRPSELRAREERAKAKAETAAAAPAAAG